MDKKSEKSILDDRLRGLTHEERAHMDSATIRVPREAFIGEIPMKHRAYLEITGIGQEVKVVELRKEETLIGRTPDCDVQIPSNNVSRKHACVGFRNEEYHIKDLDSTNGTMLNKKTITREMLHHGDKIQVGETVLQFIVEEKS